MHLNENMVDGKCTIRCISLQELIGVRHVVIRMFGMQGVMSRQQSVCLRAGKRQRYNDLLNRREEDILDSIMTFPEKRTHAQCSR
jgi:hypothetical protein